MKTILFNERYGLRTSVLEGRKTMTRRIINLKNYSDFELTDSALIDRYSRYKVGEIVAIAQPYKDIVDNPYFLNQLAANYESVGMMEEKGGWSNSMFVSSYYMPHQIRITDIKVERLQDISNEDCFKEGIERHEMINSNMEDVVRYSFKGSFINNIWKSYATPREAFAALIDKISGKGTWDKNPWVYVYTFNVGKFK